MEIFWSRLKKFLFIVFAMAFVFGLPFYFAWNADYQKAAFLCVLSIVFLLTMNADKIEAFKLWGLEAKLKEKIREAEATIDQLKTIALTLSTPIYDELAMHGQMFSHISFQHRYENKKTIDEALIKLGATKQEVNEASGLWQLVISYQLVGLIFHGEGKISDKELNQSWLGLVKRSKEKDDHIPLEEVKNFMKDNSLLSEYRKERLEDYGHYLNTGEIRHPELWGPGYVGP